MEPGLEEAHSKSPLKTVKSAKSVKQENTMERVDMNEDAPYDGNNRDDAISHKTPFRSNQSSK